MPEKGRRLRGGGGLAGAFRCSGIVMRRSDLWNVSE